MLLITPDKTRGIHFPLAWSRFSASRAAERWYVPVRRPVYVNGLPWLFYHHVHVTFLDSSRLCDLLGNPTFFFFFFWEIKCFCSPSLSQRAGRSCCSGPHSHTQPGFRWACLPLYRAFYLCQANSNRLKKKSFTHFAHLHNLWATRVRPSLGWVKMWPSFEWKTVCHTVYPPFVSFKRKMIVSLSKIIGMSSSNCWVNSVPGWLHVPKLQA